MRSLEKHYVMMSLEKQRCFTQESSSDLHRKAAVLYTGKQQ